MEAVKILYIVTTLDRGGAERQLVELVKGLDRERFIPHVYCLSAKGPLEADLYNHGVKVKAIPLRGLSLPYDLVKVIRQFARLVKFIRSERPDMVHGLLFHAYVLGTFAAKLAGVPIVISSRRSLGRFKASKLHYLFLESFANRMTDLIVANSEAVKQDVIRQEKVEPSKVRVVYNGIDPSLYDVPVDPTLRASLGIPETAKVVGVIANLIPYKGHRFFLQACSQVKQKFPKVRFLLAGNGPLRAELEWLAKDLHLGEDVLFLGSRCDIPQLLALIDVAVLPSLEEGFPNAILEAMAAGKPVVATDVGGIPEAVVHSQTGLLVPAKNPEALAKAIHELLMDSARAQQMGKAGRERVEREFGLDRMVQEMEGLYEGLLAKNAKKRMVGGQRTL